MTGRRNFGNVRRLPSGRWQASYWHLGARHLGDTTFRTKGDAAVWLSAVETAIARQAWVDPAGARMTVRDLAGHWLASNPSKRPATVLRDETIIRQHISPALGHRRLSEVTPPMVAGVVGIWASGQAPRTVGRQYAVLRAMFAFAVSCDWLSRSPCRGIRVPRPVSTRRVDLSPQDVRRIASSIGPRYEGMVWLGAILGLRWGEAAGLCVGDLDFRSGSLSVVRQLDRSSCLTPPKSAAGRRTLTMPEPVVDLLRRHIGSDVPSAPDRLLFTGPGGQPLRYTNWRTRVWLPALRAAGIEGAGFHDLRRANATQLVASGVDVKTAQTRLGHSTPHLTLAVYARATSDADRSAADRLGKRFFPSTADP